MDGDILISRIKPQIRRRVIRINAKKSQKTHLAAAAEYVCPTFEDAVNALSGRLESSVDLHDGGVG